MADFTLSGYKVTPVTVAWTSGQDLHSLTDGEATDLSDAVDNGTNLYALADVEVYIPSAAFTGSDASLVMYLVPSVDGTNYMSWSGNTTSPEQHNENYRKQTAFLRSTTGVVRVSYDNIALYNGLQKFAFRSYANVTLPATGITVKYRPHQLTT